MGCRVTGRHIPAAQDPEGRDQEEGNRRTNECPRGSRPRTLVFFPGLSLWEAQTGRPASECETENVRNFCNWLTFIQFVTDLEADKWRCPAPANNLEQSSLPSSRWTARRKMSSSVLTLITISLEVLPGFCHRLITNPYPEQEWDSIIVSSDPITVRDKTQNATAPLNTRQPQKRSYECPQNDFSCLYSDHHPDKDGSTQIVDKFLERYSALGEAPPDDRTNPPESAKDGDNLGKSYWTMVDSQTHNHPFDDKKGWVTLDPVPWSASKISKWHPNKVVIHQEEKPWDFGATTQRPVQEFWVSESSFRPERPVAHWGVATNDIITDNKPSGFPTHNFNRPEGGGGPYGYPGDRNHEITGKQPNRMQQTQHPSTYPSNGNGEWVLLSTTKGYSHPQRHRWGQKDLKPTQRVFASRKIKPSDISKYHEEDLNAWGGTNRKSDEDKTPPEVLFTGNSKDGEPSMTVHRKVRLQVLPSLVTTSSSHNGLLEVDSNPQTVDEAQQEDEDMKKLKAIANVKKSKIRGYKLVPTSKITGKGMSPTNVMTLAAVGAGMIPATMALLVPMALGRRKRSISDSRTKHNSNW